MSILSLIQNRRTLHFAYAGRSVFEPPLGYPASALRPLLSLVRFHTIPSVTDDLDLPSVVFWSGVLWADDRMIIIEA